MRKIKYFNALFLGIYTVVLKILIVVINDLIFKLMNVYINNRRKRKVLFFFLKF